MVYTCASGRPTTVVRPPNHQITFIYIVTRYLTLLTSSFHAQTDRSLNTIICNECTSGQKYPLTDRCLGSPDFQANELKDILRERKVS